MQSKSHRAVKGNKIMFSVHIKRNTCIFNIVSMLLSLSYSAESYINKEAHVYNFCLTQNLNQDVRLEVLDRCLVPVRTAGLDTKSPQWATKTSATDEMSHI